MYAIEPSALEYVEYGVLTALVCAVSATPELTDTTDPITLNGCCMVFESIAAALNALPVSPGSAHIRAQFAMHISEMRAFLGIGLGGTGDTTALLASMSARSAELTHALAAMRARLGIDRNANDGSTAE